MSENVNADLCCIHKYCNYILEADQSNKDQTNKLLILAGEAINCSKEGWGRNQSGHTL